MRLTRRSRYYLRRFSNLVDLMLVTLLIMVSIYTFYDHFFQLPTPVPPPAVIHPQVEKPLFPEQFKILLLGLDGREGLNDRSDTIILASIDTKLKKIQLLSIPRDTRVPLRGKLNKVNAAYAYGGVDLSRETISDFLGVSIDRHIIIKFPGLIKLVDLAGGLTLTVPYRMYNLPEGIDLYPGYQHLDGKDVLAYTRFRNEKYGDLERAKRQQEVIQLLVKKILKENSVPEMLEFVQAANREIETDLSLREMVALARLTPSFLENGVVSKILPGKSAIIDRLWFYEADLTNLTEVLTIDSPEACI
jgi:LCP family protein required for cell wall assembly